MAAYTPTSRRSTWPHFWTAGWFGAWIVTTAMIAAGCGSEQGLSQKVDPDIAPASETGDDPDQPVPSGESGALEGHICSPNGENGLAAAYVYILANGEEFLTQTDGGGFFRFDALPVGKWDLIVEKGSFTVTSQVVIEEGAVASLDVDDCLPIEQNEIRIAVFTGDYDAVQDVLDVLELDYDLINGRNGNTYIDFLEDLDAMRDYDILFFNCGMDFGWRGDANTITANLKTYVQEGGSVYASDWAYYFIEDTWPAKNDFIGADATFGAATTGLSGAVHATILDPAMKARLGKSKADITYDLDAWVPIEAVGADTEVLLEGTFKWAELYGYGPAETTTGPLATRVHDGLGTVIYTSFHNERQVTGDMALLLEEIILSL